MERESYNVSEELIVASSVIKSKKGISNKQQTDQIKSEWMLIAVNYK